MFIFGKTRTVGGLRRTVWYQPIALFLAIYMCAPPTGALAQQAPPPQAPRQPIFRSGSPPQPGSLAAAIEAFGARTSAPAAASPATSAPALPILPANCGWAGSYHIVQRVCVTSNTLPLGQMVTALNDFETKSVQNYLLLHGASNTPADAAFLLTYARADFRATIRTFLLLQLISLFENPRTPRTATEQAVVTWFQEVIRGYEVRLSTAALADFNKWKSTPCVWRPDPDLAHLFKMKYIACVGTVTYNNAPSEQYYLLSGRKATYETDAFALHILSNVNFPSTITPLSSASDVPFASMSLPADSPTSTGTRSATGLFDSIDTPMGVLASTFGAIAVGAAGFSAMANFVTPLRKFLLPHRNRANDARELKERAQVNAEETPEANPSTEGPNTVDNASQKVASNVSKSEAELVEGAGDTGEDVSQGFLAELFSDFMATLGFDAATGLETFGISVLVSLVVLAVTVVVQVSVSATTSVSKIETSLSSDVLAWQSGYQPDIAAMMNDASARIRLEEAWAIVTYPDRPSSQLLPAASPTDAVLMDTAILSGVAQPAVPATNFTYSDWKDRPYTPRLYGGYFIQSGSKNVPGIGIVNYTSLDTTIYYTAWDDTQYSASRVGSNFIVAKREPVLSDQLCPQPAPDALSNQPDPSICVSYVTSTIQIKDVNGVKHRLTVAHPPVFNSDPSPRFSTTDVLTSPPITVSGSPTPTVSIVPGVLPAGLTVNTTAGQATVTCCSASTPPGTYTVTLNATNTGGTATQDVDITVVSNSSPNVGITQTSAPAATARLGFRLRWSYKATGTGPFKFYTNMVWGTMQLVDHGDGSADFEGYPYDLNGVPTVCPSTANGGCSIWVTNQPTASYTYSDSRYAHTSTNFMAQPHSPDATIAGATDVSLVNGGSSIIVSASGGSGRLPVQFLTPCGIPANVHVQDTSDGAAHVWSTAPAHTSGQASFVLYPYSPGGTNPSAALCSAPNFTVHFADQLKVLSGNNPKFTVGQAGSFTLLTNDPLTYFVLDSTLPSGLTFGGSGQGTNTIQGTPAVGTGGLKVIRYHVNSSLNNQRVVRPESLYMMINEAPTVTLPTVIYQMAGLPNSYAVNPGGFQDLQSPSYLVNNMPSGEGGPQNGVLPIGVAFTSVAPIGSLSTGPTIDGMPSPYEAGASYPIVVNLSNSLGSVTANTIVKVVPAGDANHDGVVDCADYTFVKNLVGKNGSMPGYVADADLNQDGYINVLDLAFIASHVAKGTVCH